MRILLALLLSAFAAHGAVTGAVQNDSTTKHVTQPSGFWNAQPSDSTFVSAVRAAQSSTAITGAVASVQGKVGAVSLTTSDIPEGTNLYWTTVRSTNLTIALWQFALAYFYPLSNPSNFVIASAGQVTNNVNADIVVARSITANGNATFANHGNAGSPLTVDEFNGTNALAQLYNVVNGRSILMTSNADIIIGAGKFSGDGSLLTNVSLPYAAQPASGNLSNAASASQNGYLTSGDWSTFNGKISANQTITLSGDATGSGTTTITVVGVNAKNSTNFWGLLSDTNLSANVALRSVDFQRLTNSGTKTITFNYTNRLSESTFSTNASFTWDAAVNVSPTNYQVNVVHVYNTGGSTITMTPPPGVILLGTANVTNGGYTIVSWSQDGLRKTNGMSLPFQ